MNLKISSSKIETAAMLNRMVLILQIRCKAVLFWSLLSRLSAGGLGEATVQDQQSNRTRFQDKIMTLRTWRGHHGWTSNQADFKLWEMFLDFICCH